MKKQLFIAATILLTTSAGKAWAGGAQQITSVNNQATVQVITTHVNYSEIGNGRLGSTTGLLDTEKGYVPGWSFSVSRMGDMLLSHDYLDLQIDQVNGNTNYVGAPLNGSAPYGSIVSTSSAQLTNYRLRAGEGFLVNDELMLTPYLEIGHHRWFRGVNYGETYNHNYWGVGAMAQSSILDEIVLTARAMIGRTFGSQIDVAGPQGFSGGLGNSSTYRLGLSADYPLTDQLHIDLGATYESFKYGESAVFPVGGGSWEPDSTTHYMTWKLGVGYPF